MKPAGFILRIDRLGRIVIPKPVRTKFDFKTDDTLELFTNEDSVILKRYAPLCVFCSSDEELSEFSSKTVCKNCIEKIKNISD